MPATKPSRPLDLDSDFVRGLFPARCWDWAFFENAGGSYVPESVIQRVAEYMTETQVQPGASFPASAAAAERMAKGQRLMAEMIGADAREVVVGPSTTMNVFVLAKAMLGILAPSDEIVVTDADHEANIGAWRKLADHGITVRQWNLDRGAEALTLEGLDKVLTEKTRLVCFGHCSNLLGGINDVAAMTKRIHDAGALACVDGVAFAPHRALDVKALGVDIYLLSLYKVFGPHVSLMYVSRELMQRLPGQNHTFLDSEMPLKLNPGGPNHEFTAALTGVADYFEALAAHHLSDPPNTFAGRVEAVFDMIRTHEERLARPMVEFLTAKKGVRLLGPKTADAEARGPTFSFTVEGRASAEIPAAVEAARVAIRNGDFYAPRLVRALGIEDTEDGVVRASMVHYNTRDEVSRLIEALDAAI